jgi:hypothetical protein
MTAPTPANDDIDGEAVYRELLIAGGEDLDASEPSFEEVVDQALRDLAQYNAERRAWRAANRPRLVADAAADPETATFLAARAAVAARRRDLALGIVDAVADADAFEGL